MEVRLNPKVRIAGDSAAFINQQHQITEQTNNLII